MPQNWFSRRRALPTTRGVSECGTFPLDRQQVFGLDFVVNDDPAHTRVVDALLAHCPSSCAGDALGDDLLPLVVTPNVGLLVKLRRDDWAEDLESFRRAAFVVADGAPVVAVANRLDRHLGVRTPGSDLFPLIWRRARNDELPVTVVAPTDIVAKRLHEEHPDARVLVAPRFDPDDEVALAAFADEVGTLTRLGDAAPVAIFSIGNPVQTRLARLLLDSWPTSAPKPLVCCFGASAELYLGIVPRAPEWFQRHGMEWVYRFGKEPKRLFRRYFVDDVAFLRIAFDEYRKTRR